MLVGPSFGGKTTVRQTLLKAYNSLFDFYNNEQKSEEKERMLQVWQQIEEKSINPKSINIVELFGEFQELTQTWTDGLASFIMRENVAN